MQPNVESIRHFSDSSTAVLLCHGFTGDPGGMADWAQSIADAGFTVSVPLLPGHGTSWQDLNTTTWSQWYDCVRRELIELSATHDRVFVGGLSMGGALALRLAEQFGNLITGLMLVNPAVLLRDPRLVTLPVLRRVRSSVRGIASDIAKPGMHEVSYSRTPLTALASSLELYKLVRRDLSSVNVPVLMFRSLHDHVVPTASARRVLARVASTDVTDVVLVESYHVATMDYEANVIAEQSVQFLQRLSGAARPAATGQGGASRDA